MEQNQSQSEGFWQKNRNYLIAAAIVVLAIVYFASSGNNTTDEADNDQQTQEQAMQENEGNTDNEGEQNQEESAPNQNQNQNGSQGASPDTETVGNVTAVGTLMQSDNPARGNLVLDSNRGKIYIATARDFTQFLGKQVTLEAQGTLNSFTFLGFTEGGVGSAPVDEDAKGGDGEAGMVVVTGKLETSDSESRGNYVIYSNQGKIYLKTVRDYTAWVGSNVELTAVGTIHSFTGARLMQK